MYKHFRISTLLKQDLLLRTPPDQSDLSSIIS